MVKGKYNGKVKWRKAIHTSWAIFFSKRKKKVMFNQLSKQLGLEAELYTESDFTNRSTDLTNNRSGNELYVYLFFDEKCWKKEG